MATRYAKAAGGNWSSANTWSATSSAGVDNAGAPAATDDVIFDAGANTAVVVDTTTCVAKTVIFQNAANSVTFTAGQKLTVSGNYTQVAGMTVTGTGTLVINAAATLTSGGITFPGALTFSFNGTIALGDAWTVTGVVTNTVSTCTLNSSNSAWTLTTNGGLAVNAYLFGSTTIILGGGTWSGGASELRNKLTFAGNVIVSGIVTYDTGTMTYTSGTITTTGSTLKIGSDGTNATTLNTSGIIWDAVQTVGGPTDTITLTSNLRADGLVTIGVTTILNTSTGKTATFNGGLTVSAAISGTAEIILGGGTWSGSLAVNNNLTFNGSSTISGTVQYRTGVMTYTAGTITTTSSLLNIQAACTLNTNGIIWDKILNNVNTITITLTSNLRADGLVTINSTTTINTSTSKTATFNGGITVSAGLLGTAELILGGGTWGGNSAIEMNLTFAGNVTISNAATRGYKTGTMTYTSGTITTTGSAISFQGGVGCTLNTDGITWNIVRFNYNTHTLTSNLTASGLVYIDNVTTINTSTGKTLNCNGGISVGSAVTGTATIILGGGIWSGASTIANNMSINCTTATISGGVNYTTNTLLYTAGTITVTNSTLGLAGSCTLNTTGLTWGIVAPSGTTFTTTLGSALACEKLLINSGVVATFAGNFDITCTTLELGAIATTTLSLVSGRTLTVNTNMYLSGDGSPDFLATIKAVTPSSDTHLNFGGLASAQKVFSMTFTDIDASGSAQVIDNWYGGTLLRTTNITNRTSADIGGTTSNVFGWI